ncbi:isocitrate lyase/PEP mutase family protein [Luteibacter sp. 329MFSha]|uniref:isocitrate lyase/PEP mutase family protein n=1 Tax=Luteibacter sp. 329MFSha TaxID=1798239 RepID=UPI0008D7EDDB|nr:isocitrate lyase/PEP mutase family protein [Luteibacter sp. 329MFSha]SEV92875.1 2-Methylisocitrate lyase, PEP mutase family [Luteibacter sp. 329MFSha]
MSESSGLGTLLAAPGMTIVPGAYDAIGARLIEEAGFAAAYMTGAGTALARGYPDLGLITMTEMVENAGTMARAIGIPLIADADTGFGNELNVTRCVREYEARGVAAIHIEDQVMPKRCGHLDGKEVVSRQEFLAKIRAAVAARRHPGFGIIARTDARAVLGFDEAVWRANAALDAGADMAFVEATQTLDEAASVPRLVAGPCVLNVVPGGRTPLSDLGEAESMGYRMAILPALVFMATIDAADAVLATLRRTRVSPPREQNIAQMFRRFDADRWDALRSRFLGEDVTTP